MKIARLQNLKEFTRPDFDHQTCNLNLIINHP